MPPSKEARVQIAILAYQKGQIKSVLRAANIFSVPESTLRDQLHGKKSRSETRANNHKLSISEEKAPIQKLLNADEQGFPIQPEFLHEMVQILLCEQLQDATATLGVNWAYSFIKCCPEIRTRYTR